MKRFIQKCLKLLIGSILRKLYLFFLTKHKYIPSFLRTPIVINFFMQLMLEYESDQKQFGVIEYFDTSIEVLNNLKADCDGFSQIAKDLLHQKYHPYLLKIISFNEKEDIRERFKGHMTCVYTTKDSYLKYIDNTGLSEIKFLREKDIGKDLIKRLYSSGYELFEVKRVE